MTAAQERIAALEQTAEEENATHEAAMAERQQQAEQAAAEAAAAHEAALTALRTELSDAKVRRPPRIGGFLSISISLSHFHTHRHGMPSTLLRSTCLSPADKRCGGVVAAGGRAAQRPRAR